VRFLAGAGVTANHITLAAILLSSASGVAILYFPFEHWPLIVIAPVLFVRMALNAIDGMLAREHNMKTPLGAILNELGDVFSDTMLYLPLAACPFICPFMMVPVVVLSIISEMAGVVSIQIGGERRYDGPMGKSDRAFVLGMMALLLGCGVPPGKWVDVVLSLSIMLLSLTILNRARMALETTRKGA
jgi:CDP-diacylglycerol--glycerol-3-phosphate 3-phosphatidyltransferase